MSDVVELSGNVHLVDEQVNSWWWQTADNDAADGGWLTGDEAEFRPGGIDRGPVNVHGRDAVCTVHVSNNVYTTTCKLHLSNVSFKTSVVNRCL